jgi:hypothetical protein
MARPLPPCLHSAVPHPPPSPTFDDARHYRSALHHSDWALHLLCLLFALASGLFAKLFIQHSSEFGFTLSLLVRTIPYMFRPGAYLEIDKVLKEFSLTEEISKPLHRIDQLPCQLKLSQLEKEKAADLLVLDGGPLAGDFGDIGATFIVYRFSSIRLIRPPLCRGSHLVLHLSCDPD